MKIRPVRAVLFHAGGRADGLTEGHDLRTRLKIWVWTQTVELVRIHDGGTSLKGSDVANFDKTLGKAGLWLFQISVELFHTHTHTHSLVAAAYTTHPERFAADSNDRKCSSIKIPKEPGQRQRSSLTPWPHGYPLPTPSCHTLIVLSATKTPGRLRRSYDTSEKKGERKPNAAVPRLQNEVKSLPARPVIVR